jgi:hypothetical protein
MMEAYSTFWENGEMHTLLIVYLEGRDYSQDLDVNDRIRKEP